MSEAFDVKTIQEIVKECSKLGYALRQVSCLNQRLLMDYQGINAYGERSLTIDLMLEELCLNFFKGIPSICHIISEESGYINLGRGCLTVIIDPLDGTKNFTMGLSYYACSIAILNEVGDLLGAYVVNLANGHEFTAVKGHGAFRNGIAIRSSSHQTVRDCDGIFVGLAKRETELRMMKNIIVQLKSYRAMGCAALDLCCLAMGAASVFVDISKTAKVVDVLASALILEEAGGRITDESFIPVSQFTKHVSIKDMTIQKRFMVVGGANAKLHEILIDLLGLRDKRIATTI